MRIERIDARRLEIPLTKPYRLAFGPVAHYDTILVEAIGDAGERGYGEATLLTGYTDETIAGGYALAREIARQLPGMDRDAACAHLAAVGARAPFVATAFRTALDMAMRHPLLSVRQTTRVPLVGLLQGTTKRSCAMRSTACSRRAIARSRSRSASTSPTIFARSR